MIPAAFMKIPSLLPYGKKKRLLTQKNLTLQSSRALELTLPSPLLPMICPTLPIICQFIT